MVEAIRVAYQRHENRCEKGKGGWSFAEREKLNGRMGRKDLPGLRSFGENLDYCAAPSSSMTEVAVNRWSPGQPSGAVAREANWPIESNK